MKIFLEGRSDLLEGTRSYKDRLKISPCIAPLTIEHFVEMFLEITVAVSCSSCQVLCFYFCMIQMLGTEVDSRYHRKPSDQSTDFLFGRVHQCHKIHYPVR